MKILSIVSGALALKYSVVAPQRSDIRGVYKLNHVTQAGFRLQSYDSCKNLDCEDLSYEILLCRKENIPVAARVRSNHFNVSDPSGSVNEFMGSLIINDLNEEPREASFDDLVIALPWIWKMFDPSLRDVLALLQERVPITLSVGCSFSMDYVRTLIQGIKIKGIEIDYNQREQCAISAKFDYEKRGAFGKEVGIPVYMGFFGELNTKRISPRNRIKKFRAAEGSGFFEGSTLDLKNFKALVPDHDPK